VGEPRLVGAVHLVGVDNIVGGAPHLVGTVHLVGGAALLVAPCRVGASLSARLIL
jgi:hypothetical protein